MSAQQQNVPSAHRELADKMRSRQGIETHSAIAEGMRVEYIRGQDLVAYAQQHPELFERFSKGRPAAEQAKEVGELLLRRGLLRRCDHLYKKPPAGKKLAKFPRKMVFFEGAEAFAFAEESFYAWMYERPTSPWVYVGAAVAVVGALLVSLFPLAPYWVKVAVLYTSAGLLISIIALMVVRAVLAAASWVATGKAVWLLPNVLAEVPVSELFQPIVSVEASDPSHWGSHPLARLGVGAGMCGMLYLLYAHAPDKGAVAREASKYRDEIFDLLNVHKEGYQRLGAGNATSSGAEGVAGNATAAGAAGEGKAGEPAAPQGGPGEPRGAEEEL